jgi:hypothetical protein
MVYNETEMEDEELDEETEDEDEPWVEAGDDTNSI